MWTIIWRVVNYYVEACFVDTSIEDGPCYAPDPNSIAVILEETGNILPSLDSYSARVDFFPYTVTNQNFCRANETAEAA